MYTYTLPCIYLLKSILRECFHTVNSFADIQGKVQVSVEAGVVEGLGVDKLPTLAS